MTTITGKVLDATGTGVPGAVNITLISPSAGYTGSGEIVSRTAPVVASDGTWSVALTPNGLITPSGTYYQVVETYRNQSKATLIVVPSSGGPYNVAAVVSVDAGTSAISPYGTIIDGGSAA